MMVHIEKLSKENLDDEMKYIYKNMNKQNKNKLISNFIKLLFNYNSIKISIFTIEKCLTKKYDLGNHFYYFVSNDFVKDEIYLKDMILDEINLIMANDEYLYNRFLNPIDKEFNKDYEFIEI